MDKNISVDSMKLEIKEEKNSDDADFNVPPDKLSRIPNQNEMTPTHDGFSCVSDETFLDNTVVVKREDGTKFIIPLDSKCDLQDDEKLDNKDILEENKQGDTEYSGGTLNTPDIEVKQERNDIVDDPCNNDYKCVKCFKKFETSAELISHDDSFHSLQPRYFCPDKDCNETFITRQSMVHHITYVHEEKEHFNNTSNLRGPNRLCHREWKTPIMYLDNNTKHAQRMDNICSICYKDFNSKYTLNLHLLCDHVTDYKPFGKRVVQKSRHPVKRPLKFSSVHEGKKDRKLPPSCMSSVSNRINHNLIPTEDSTTCIADKTLQNQAKAMDENVTNLNTCTSSNHENRANSLNDTQSISSIGKKSSHEPSDLIDSQGAWQNLCNAYCNLANAYKTHTVQSGQTSHPITMFSDQINNIVNINCGQINTTNVSNIDAGVSSSIPCLIPGPSSLDPSGSSTNVPKVILEQANDIPNIVPIQLFAASDVNSTPVFVVPQASSSQPNTVPIAIAPSSSGVKATKTFPCSEDGCNKSFQTSRSLHYHKCKVHRERKIECSECGKKFKTNSQLFSHMAVHVTEKTFLCKVEGCKKSFENSYRLSHHCRRVHKEKRHICPECNKPFSTKTDLQLHMAVHACEKLIPCPEEGCDKSFKLQRHLYNHRRYTHGNRNYKCPECDKMFKTNSHLKTHAFVHVSEKTLVCPEVDCGRSFKTPKEVGDHVRFVHIKEHVCPACRRCFKSKPAMDSHKCRQYVYAERGRKKHRNVLS